VRHGSCYNGFYDDDFILCITGVVIGLMMMTLFYGVLR
jgi:hypothetical protein